MTTIIGVAGQKGGVGKSTIVRALDCAYTAAGWNTIVADLDITQSTVQLWLQTRLQYGHEPSVAVQSFANVAQAMRVAPNYDAMIFDGGAFASKTTVEIAKASDLVIIPTGFAVDDMRPSAGLANELADKHGIPVERIAFAFCRAGDSPAEQVEARNYLLKTRFHVLSGSIPEKAMYRRAHDEGLSVIETRHKGLRDKADVLIQSIVDRAQALANA